MASRGLEPGLEEALEAAFRAAGRPLPAVLAAEPVAGGSINRACRLRTRDLDLFCKWNPGGPEDMFAREAEGLRAMAGSGAHLVVPRVVALTPEGSGPAPALVLEWLEPSRAGASDADWEALGRGLAEMHRGGADRFGFPADNYCGLTPQENAWDGDWAAFFADRRLGALVRRLETSGRLDAAQAAVFRKLRDRLPRLLGHGPAPSLIHGDLWSGNFLASGRGPALIDPAAYYGDREAEWAMMLLFGGFPERVLGAYLDAWPLPAGWRERIPLYQLYHVLNHQLLFGGGYGAQALRIASRYL